MTEVLRQAPFPNDLEGRMNSILNVVNSELKILTLLHLDDVPVSRDAIKKRIRETVGGGIYIPEKSTYSSYGSTLASIGAMAIEETTEEESEKVFTEYRLTQSGRIYGRPICAFTLNFVFGHNESMNSILGSTASKGNTRGPMNKFRFLNKLRNGELRRVDIEGEDCEMSMNFHIEDLVECGFISYDSQMGHGADSFVYHWVGRPLEEVNAIRGNTYLMVKISEHLNRKNCLNYEELCTLVAHDKSSISNSLKNLINRGFVRRGEWKGGFKVSNCKLTPRGRMLLTDYIDPLESALKDEEFLTEMQRQYEELISNSERFREVSRTAINLYREVSPNMNSGTFEENYQRIMQYLKENDGARNKDIGENIGIKSPGKYLSLLLKRGIVRKERKGNSMRYYLIK